MASICAAASSRWDVGVNLGLYHAWESDVFDYPVKADQHTLNEIAGHR